MKNYEEATARGRGHGLVDGEFIDLVTPGHARATISNASAPIWRHRRRPPRPGMVPRTVVLWSTPDISGIDLNKETMTQILTEAEQALRDAARDYHRCPTPGKISLTPTKPLSNQRDLSLAYSPGVAYPCLDIQADPKAAAEYTSRGNLVGVITNGTAVLGLGDIGPLAGKARDGGQGLPVQEVRRHRRVRHRAGRARPGQARATSSPRWSRRWAA